MFLMSKDLTAFELKPLGECVEVLDFLRKPLNSEARRIRQGNIPYYGANGKLDTIDEWIFNEDLVLVAEDGGFFEDSTKPISYRITGKAWVNNHAHVLRPKNGIDVDWLNFSISFQDTRHLIKGATLKKLNQADLKKILIPCPEIDEQRRIVARIKDCMERVEEIEGLRAEAVEEAGQIFRSRCMEVFSSGFPELPVKDLISTKPFNGIFKRRKDFGEGVLLANVKDLYGDQTLDLNALERVRATAKEVQRYSLTPGEVLVNRSSLKREGTGRSCVFEGHTEPVVFECHIMKISLAPDKLHPHLFAAFMNSPLGLSRILDRAKTATMTTWNQDDLQSIMIPIPPFELQTDLVEEFSKLRAFQKELCTRLQNSELKYTRESILRKAFSGEL